MLILTWILIVLLTGVSCLFAACAYALRTFNHIRLQEELALRGQAERMQPMLERRGRLALTAAAARVLANIAIVLLLALFRRLRWL